MKRSALLVSLLLVAAGATRAAPPEIPDQVPYSGGVPGGGAGPVDLTVRIYDAATGGTLLYVQDFAAVALADGAFELALGPVGRGTDVPADPLTTILVLALAWDLPATAAGRFIEVTVDTDPPLPRERVLAVPFALRAASAESADTAASADQVVQVGGLPPEVLTQIYENTNFDGGPPNTDPREGLGDVDGDGIANFMDPDNDGDTISDSDEIDMGSDINLVTPTITGFSPPSVAFGAQETVQVQGAFFESGITVVFGNQTPTPTNVTGTSFDVLVGPQSGEAPVTVTRLNGESAASRPPRPSHSETEYTARTRWTVRRWISTCSGRRCSWAGAEATAFSWAARSAPPLWRATSPSPGARRGASPRRASRARPCRSSWTRTATSS
jgi:hypothetical protein